MILRLVLRAAAPLAASLVLSLAAAPAFAQAPPAKPPQAEICDACHGPNGNAVIPENPSLAGQTWRYIYIELKDFSEGRRTDPIMSPISKVLSRDEMIALGNWYAAQKPAVSRFNVDPVKVDAGRKIADAVLCPMCHGGGFGGQNEVPRVAGQNPGYISKQLHDFKAKRRTNDAGNMTSVAHTLSEEDIENLAQYIANLN
jgi:cytochrome c553